MTSEETAQDTPPKPDRDRVLDLATRLVVAQLGNPGSADPLPLDDARHDRFFDGALRRAERLLLGPSADSNIVWAEQLFGPEEILSAGKIAAKFEEWGWTGYSENTVRKRLLDIAKWMADRLEVERDQFEESLEEVDSHVREFVQDLAGFCDGWDDGPMTASASEEVQRVADGVRDFAYGFIYPSSPEQSAYHEMRQDEELAKWCFAGSTPWQVVRRFRPASSPDDDGGAAQEPAPSNPEEELLKEAFNDEATSNLQCRPHAVFRYVHVYGKGDEPISEIREKAQIQRKELSLELTPDSLGEVTREFAGFDGRFHQYIRRSVEQGRQELEEEANAETSPPDTPSPSPSAPSQAPGTGCAQSSEDGD